VARLTVDDQGVIALADVFLDAFIQIQLGPHLVEIDHLAAVSQLDLTLLREQFPQQHLQQGCFAGAVGADDADAVSAHDRGGKILDDAAAVVGEAGFQRFGHQCTGALGRLQLDLGRALLLAALAVFLAQFLQRPYPPFVAGTAGLDSLTNPGFLLGQLLVEQGLAGDLGFQQGLAAQDEFIVAAGKGIDPPAVQLGHAVGQAPGKGAIVGYEQHGLDRFGQELLQPEDRIDIQVVGRFVQNQDVGR